MLLRPRAIGIATALLLVGCASTTPTADKTATAALVQLVTYETEVTRKIRDENEYYTGVMDAASERIVDLWSNETAFKFEQEASAFVVRNANLDKDRLGTELVKYIDASKRSWASRDERYEALQVESQRGLRENREKLEIELGQIRSLRGTLQNLSEARSDKEMLLLAIAFARESKVQYDKLKASPSEASGDSESQ